MADAVIADLARRFFGMKRTCDGSPQVAATLAGVAVLGFSTRD